MKQLVHTVQQTQKQMVITIIEYGKLYVLQGLMSIERLTMCIDSCKMQGHREIA